MTNQEKLDCIIAKLTSDEIAVQAMEECAELQQALSKFFRITSANNHSNETNEAIYKNITEEVADVFLCLKVLADDGFYAMDEVEQIADYKLNRWVNRLNGDWTE